MKTEKNKKKKADHKSNTGTGSKMALFSATCLILVSATAILDDKVVIVNSEGGLTDLKYILIEGLKKLK